MPELPEVETVVRQLSSKLVGQKIVKIDIRDHLVVSSTIKKIIPAKILGISRYGKWIILNLDQHRYLVIHLRMTGHFYYIPKENNPSLFPQKYVAGIFHLDSGSHLTFNSIRRFERIFSTNQKGFAKLLAKLGPDPLAENFTFPHFNSLLNRFPHANIKTKLMDQHFLAGVGNIYAQEALYRAKINPLQRIQEISPPKLKQLYSTLRTLLQQAIDHNGTTVHNFAHIDGKGDFQNFLAVYQKDKCQKSHLITRIVQAGRSTYYCPVCQK